MYPSKSLLIVLAQQVIVENRPGAAGNIATEQVARAAPDELPTISEAGLDAEVTKVLAMSEVKTALFNQASTRRPARPSSSAPTSSPSARSGRE